MAIPDIVWNSLSPAWWITAPPGGGMPPICLVCLTVFLLMQLQYSVTKLWDFYANPIRVKGHAQMTCRPDLAVMHLRVQAEGPDTAVLERRVGRARDSIEARLNTTLSDMQRAVSTRDTSQPQPRSLSNPWSPWAPRSAFCWLKGFKALGAQPRVTESAIPLSWEATGPETTTLADSHSDFDGEGQTDYRVYVMYRIQFLDSTFVAHFANQLVAIPAASVNAIEWSFSEAKKKELDQQLTAEATKHAKQCAESCAKAGKQTIKTGARGIERVDTKSIESLGGVIVHTASDYQKPHAHYLAPNKRLPRDLFRVPTMPLQQQLAMKFLAA